MKMTRRILSWVLAVSLLVSCGITGLVLPASAEAAVVDLINGQGTFEEGTTPESTILSDMMAQSASAAIVANPNGEGNVLQLGAADTFKHGSYPKLKKLYDAEKGTYTKYMTAGKCYTLTLDVYGDGIGLYFQGEYTVLSENAEERVDVKNGWFQLGPNEGLTEWKTYTFVFYPSDNIKENYHADWWSWGMNFSKGGNDYCPTSGYTYIDNIKLVETQATAIALDKERVVLEIGDKTEAPVVTATPVRSAYADIVYTSDDEEVAKVDATTGVITAIGFGTTTITATAGELTDTITVTVQEDKTQEFMDMSKFVYDSDGDCANAELRGKPVPVQTDAATGYQYVTMAGGNQIHTNSFTSLVTKDEWVGVTFLVRVTDAANNTGSVRGAVQWQGGITDGYTQPEFYTRTTALQNHGWQRVTFYAKAMYAKCWPWFQFLTLSGGNAAVCSYDIAELSTFRPEADDMNLFGYGADLESGYVPMALGNHEQSGLITKSEIVDDPTGADNKVLYVSSEAAGSGVDGVYFSPANRTMTDANGAREQYFFRPGKMYKISFRVYSASKVAIDSYGNAAFKGFTGGSAAAGQWRQVTAYMYEKADSTYKNAYALHVRFYGEAYVDDFQLYEVVDATGFEIKGDSVMTLPNSQTLDVVALPKHAFPGTLTWSVEGAGLSLSGSTLKTAYVKGTTVTGGTVTVTSNLLDESGAPITGTFDVKVNYPEDMFPNGSFDTGDDSGIKFSNLGTSWDYVENGGVDGSRCIKFMTTGAKYMTGTTRHFRPNSVYRFTVMARCDVDGVADLELNYVTGNTASLSAYGTATHSNISSDWTYFYYFLKTGDAPNNTNSNYNFYLHVRGLGTNSAPIYVDNISCELIESGENMLPDSTLTYADHKFDARTAGGSKKFPLSYVSDPADPTNKVLAVNNSATSAYDVTEGFPYLDPYAMYEITFDSKVNEQWTTDASSMNFYIGEDTVQDGKVTAERRGDNVFYGTSSIKQTAEWQSNRVVIFTNSKARWGGNTFHFNVSKGAASGEGYIYIDNLQIRRVDDGQSLHTVHSSAYKTYVSIDGKNWNEYLEDVPAGTLVHVRTWGNSADKGKVLRSVTARGANGTVSILNKDILNGYTEENFGKEGASDRTFQFIMPENGGAQIKTVLASATNTNYYMNTVGTSLRYTDANGNFDGIRFLTRMTFANGAFDADDPDNFTLLKDGVTYNVVEIGSLLKRYSETTTGEGEAAVTTEDELTLENSKWSTVAYKRGETDMKLLDYTNYYIDFASVMRKGASLDQDVFNARKYTARGYMVLEDAEGNQVTILAETQQSASVNEIAPLV